MNIDEIYKELGAHILEGIMIHEQFIKYYYFLGLSGYAKCHEYHFYSENKNYLKLNYHYQDKYDKIIPKSSIEEPLIIPSIWEFKCRNEISQNDKQKLIKAGYEEWLKWEKDTLEFYNRIYSELLSIKNFTDLSFIEYFMDDVSKEIIYIKQNMLDKESNGYDMAEIISEQKEDSKRFNFLLTGGIVDE